MNSKCMIAEYCVDTNMQLVTSWCATPVSSVNETSQDSDDYHIKSIFDSN